MSHLSLRDSAKGGTCLDMTLGQALCIGQEGRNSWLLNVAYWNNNAALWQHGQPATSVPDHGLDAQGQSQTWFKGGLAMLLTRSLLVVCHLQMPWYEVLLLGCLLAPPLRLQRITLPWL